jgi:hypothetical protein
MVFGKKKGGMVDIRELMRQGKVRREGDDLPDLNTNKDGFVDMGHPSNKAEVNVASENNSDSAMDFVNVGESGGGFSGEADGYSKREVDARIEKLDSTIYKLEQRIELLERKAGVEVPSEDSSSVGVMGW